MADEIVPKDDPVGNPAEGNPEEEPRQPDSPDETPVESIDYEALALAEKERADAAEALIIKNKAISKRHRGEEPEIDPEIDEEDKPVTRKELEEIIKNFKPEESEESRRLVEAQKKVDELQSKHSEIIRALKAKEGVNKVSGNFRDPMKGSEPKLAPADEQAIKATGFIWDGAKKAWKKPLPGGKHMWMTDLKSPHWIE